MINFDQPDEFIDFDEPNNTELIDFDQLNITGDVIVVQALAGDLSDQNREACAETTKPLLEAVEGLTMFASSPQFASVPAKISAQARKAQEPILEVCRVHIVHTHTHTSSSLEV